MSAEGQLEQLIDKYPVLESCKAQIWEAFEVLRECYRKDGMLLVCGNGGSAADSEHIAGELMKEFAIRRPLSEKECARLEEVSPEHGKILGEHLQGSLPTIPLTGNLALSTAYANDAVPELVFAQQVYGYGRPEHVLLGISTSGNSGNVIYAAETAKLKEMSVIGLTGKSGGKLKELCDVCICVPETVTADIQELHLPVYHALCRMVEEEFFG